MARIPPTKRLTIEDYKDQSSWIGRLIFPINDFFQYVSLALNKNLTIADNLAQELHTVQVTLAGTASDYPILFRTNLKTVVGLHVINCYEIASSPSVITSAVYVSWQNTGTGQIQVNNITGLTTGKKYSITLVVIAG
jgi:hypothetical protein